MVFTNDGIPAPEGLRRDEFLLRPLRASDAELDYEAVMESRAFLRLWEQSSWPSDDFTLEGNREDLDKHERQHIDGESFTYTVMNTAETQCLGCIYILPLTARMFSNAQITALDGDEWSAYDATVFFWIRESRLADQVDRRLLDALRPWFAHEWQMAHVLFVTNEQFEQQVAMIEGAGLELAFTLEYTNKPGKFLAYADGISGT